MKTQLSIILTGCIAHGLFAQTATSESPLSELVRAERAFSTMSAERGIKPAFLAFLSDSAVIFRPRRVNGKEWYAKRPNPPATLVWSPAFADISAAGDMGYTTGPWKLTGNTPNDSVPQYGHYVSIWRKEAGGSWKVVIDLGVSTPQQELSDEVLSPPVHRSSPVDTRSRSEIHFEKERVRFRDQMFSDESLRGGILSACIKYLTVHARVYRSNNPPAVGLGAIQTLLGDSVSSLTVWETDRTEIAASGDMGYTCGTYREKMPGLDGLKARPDREGCYLRIWRKEQDDWKVVLDIFNEVPKE